MDNKKDILLFEAFAGIGAQYKALKNISNKKKWNIVHKGMIEWYVDAIIAYCAIHSPKKIFSNEKLLDNYKISHDSKSLASHTFLKKIDNTIKSAYLNYSKNFFNNHFDIKTVKSNDIPKNLDIFTYSFPCQDLSIQGLQKGIKKGSNTRSGLLWEIERILTEISEHFEQCEMPKYLLMENVKSLTNKLNISDYEMWINRLSELGYESKSYILNSKNFGSSQNRERVFLISISKYWKEKTNFIFPTFDKVTSCKKLSSILIDDDDHQYLNLSMYKTTEMTKTKSGIYLKRLENYTKFNSENYIYFPFGFGPTLTASGANSRIKIDIDHKIRYMSAIEAYIYMGFDKEDYLNVKKTNLLSNNRIIYTAGNSISVEVLESIFNSFVF